MAGLILTVRVAAAALRESGDGKDEAGENIVNVALIWPRPGKSEVLGSTGVVRLRDRPGPGAEPDRPSAFLAPVLKEKVQGDCAILVQVLDQDRQGRFNRFLRQVAAAGIEGFAGTLAFSVPNAIRLAFTEAAEQGAIHAGPERSAEDRIEAIAVSSDPLVLTGEQLAVMASESLPRTVQVALEAPGRLERPREKGRLAPGRANGWIFLELKVEDE